MYKLERQSAVKRRQVIQARICWFVHRLIDTRITRPGLFNIKREHADLRRFDFKTNELTEWGWNSRRDACRYDLGGGGGCLFLVGVFLFVCLFGFFCFVLFGFFVFVFVCFFCFFLGGRGEVVNDFFLVEFIITLFS